MQAEKLTIVGQLQAMPEKEEALRDALLALIPSSGAEAGCINYDSHESIDTQTYFYYIRIELVGQHSRFISVYFTPKSEEAKELLAKPLQMTALRKIS